MRLYHATWPTNMRSIRSSGINPSSPFEGVYLANEPHYAAGFMRLRSVEFKGFKTMEIGGVTHQVPDVVQHDEIIVFEIDGDRLDQSRLEESSDHNASAFPADLVSYVYDGKIPASAITNTLSYPL